MRRVYVLFIRRFECESMKRRRHNIKNNDSSPRPPSSGDGTVRKAGRRGCTNDRPNEMIYRVRIQRAVLLRHIRYCAKRASRENGEERLMTREKSAVNKGRYRAPPPPPPTMFSCARVYAIFLSGIKTTSDGFRANRERAIGKYTRATVGPSEKV